MFCVVISALGFLQAIKIQESAPHMLALVVSGGPMQVPFAGLGGQRWCISGHLKFQPPLLLAGNICHCYGSDALQFAPGGNVADLVFRHVLVGQDVTPPQAFAQTLRDR